MTEERWIDLVSTIKDKFPVTAEGKTDREDGPGTVTFIEFTGPMGSMRLEFDVHPVITGKRAIGGHRVGSGSKVQYEYSDTEEAHTFHVFQRQGEEWVEIDAHAFPVE